MIYLSRRHGDREGSGRRIHHALSEQFGERRVAGSWDRYGPGTDHRDQLERQLRHSDVVVVVIGPDWLTATDLTGRRRLDDAQDVVRMEIECALEAGKQVIPVLVDGAEMPPTADLPGALKGLTSRLPLEILGGEDFEEGLHRLVYALHATLDRTERPPSALSPPRGLPADQASEDSLFGDARAPASPSPAFDDDLDIGTTASPARESPFYPASPLPDFSDTQAPAPVPFPSLPPPPSPVARSGSPPTTKRDSGVLAGLVNGFRSLWKSRDDRKESAASPANRAPRPDPTVLLAASAPRSSAPDTEFTAALVAYVAEAHDSALKKLIDLGEPGDRRVSDIATGVWRVGAPVTVRLAGKGVTVKPDEIRFEWSGRENLAAFSVAVDSRPRDAVLLSFEVFVADVLVSSIPMRVSLASADGSEATDRVHGSLPSSAFASYSSQDAEAVTQRLSTLTRWAPGLDIFQDCLDLRPGDAFKPQLKSQIARRDVFLLFWSRRAASSPWVRWEYTTAIQTRGMTAILAMPLEDPAIAPPPPELADQHQRDRFMLAGYGLAKVREETERRV